MSLNLELKSILDKIVSVEGDVVELGVHTGNNSVQFMWQVQNKKYFGFDTFCGYTEEDIQTSPNKEGLIDNVGRWNHDKKETVKRLEDFKENFCIDTEFEIVQGDLKETLPQYIKEGKIKKISMLYVDCNAYLPAITGIRACYPIMPKGAIICIDEHQVGGETQAILETALEHGLDVVETGYEFISGPNSNPSKYIVKK
tara:strand:- start:381 stop:977 length:597 start_codon:yes stop_codon:yes gene_type:complete